ncbi:MULTISPECIES: TetR/AcrR family transcriptional regulator [unclassified Nitratiruptor]|uniref:TetR/AcrR family transcriptional regulator n=1 Tax=unclassified Nitratiruptor TaxID=2624044 RepID=UPI0019151FFC|nr:MULTISPECIES: TetR/AcrR family transcriptional regulator [unclassified Nitratiruptor]BCD61001.1 transcriptional regulator, TetR family [Nitratiruptor sp. YY08-10]BCD64933.1 transcriptional regulator, TetR family [Nitratiruptor sp. YY08-14]
MKELIKQKIVETKKEILLEAVSNLFEQQGFANLKMQDIAKYLGISVGALYKIFASKEDLLLAYIEFEIQKFYRMLRNQTKNINDPFFCLQHYVNLKFEVFRQKRRAIEDPLMGDPLFFLKMGKKQYMLIEPIHKLLASWFERLHTKHPLKEKNFLKIAYLFNSYTNGYVEYWIVQGDELDPKQVVELFLQGVQQ